MHEEACSKMKGMKWIKPVFHLLIMNLLFTFNVYASENIFELIAPSSYKPANLLKEFDSIDGGNYRLNLSQNIHSLFPGQKISNANLYLVLPSACVISDISANYKIHRRMDYNYYVFQSSPENNLLIDLVADMKMPETNVNDFGFVVVAYDEQGKQLIYEQHDNSMHKEIVLRQYLTGQ